MYGRLNCTLKKNNIPSSPKGEDATSKKNVGKPRQRDSYCPNLPFDFSSRGKYKKEGSRNC